MKRFVFTCGDVNGIGPEIVIKTLNKISNKKSNDRFYFICPTNVFNKTINHIKPQFKYKIVDRYKAKEESPVLIINTGGVIQKFGQPTNLSGAIAYKSLKMSFDLVENNKADAIVTAPISKIALKMAGIRFKGQTEMFAKWTGTKNYAMTFLSNRIFVALLTIHIPINNVSNSINSSKLEILLNIIIRMLKQDLSRTDPKIAVLGLNPHAGEYGLIGKDELSVISPIIEKYSDKFLINGPFSPDAFFGSKKYQDFDMIIGMYHDQILIPFKMLTFGKGVNYTAGLPIVRTSPDHGVAYDIAEKYIADESSMVNAYKYARLIVGNRDKLIVKS